MGTGIYQPAFTFSVACHILCIQADEESGCRPQEVIDANKRLKELNDELHLSNAQLKEANHSIAENSYLKRSISAVIWTSARSIWKDGQLPPVAGKIAATGKCGGTLQEHQVF